jgi:hypothetical protein
MPDCQNCGSPLDPETDKNASGWWRDSCIGCMAERSGAVQRGARQPITESDEYREWLEGGRE